MVGVTKTEEELSSASTDAPAAANPSLPRLGAHRTRSDRYDIDHRPEQRHGRPPTIPIIGTGLRMVIRASRKPSDHPTIANVSGSAVRDRDPPIRDYLQKTDAI